MFDVTERSVLIFGDIMLDVYSEGSVARVSPEAPVPVVLMSREQYVPGGAANVAANVATLGASAHLVGVVGNDAHASALSKMMTAQFPRVSLSGVVVTPRPTTTKTRIVGNHAQVVRIDREDSSALDSDTELQLLAMFEQKIGECDIVVLSDYAKGVCTDFLIRNIIELTNIAGKQLLVDPKRRDFSIYAGATIIKPNLKELEAASFITDGEDGTVERAARTIVEQTGASLIVTRSERGMSYIGGSEQAIHIPTAARTVFDVSGAGDTVMATLSVMLNPHAPADGVAHALAVANAAAGIVVAKAGTATVTPAEIAIAMMGVEKRTHRSACKVVSRNEAQVVSASWRDQGLTVGFTNGCFDLLHPGHVQILEQSRELCDRLIVGLNRDASVSRLKGPNRPVQNEDARAIVMASLYMVDLVVLFDEDTPAEIIREILPNFLFKGGDYTVDTVVGGDTVINAGGRVVIVDLVPNSSTTNLVKRANEGRHDKDQNP